MKGLLEELKKKIVEELDLKDVTRMNWRMTPFFSTEAWVWIPLT